MFARIKPSMGKVIGGVRTMAPRLLPHLVSGLLFFSAALPSWYVVQHLWVDNMEVTQEFTELWCRYEFLCELRLPSYLLLIFSVFLAVPLVFLVYRGTRARLPIIDMTEEQTVQQPPSAGARQTAAASLLILTAMGVMAMMVFWATMRDRIAELNYVFVYLAFLIGWMLLDRPLHAWVQLLRTEIPRTVLMALFHAAIVVLVSSMYARINPWLGYAAAVIYVVCFILLRRKLKASFVAIILITLALIVYLYQVNAWWYAIVGDEYSFLRYARLILESSPEFTAEHLLDGTAVYGSHPFFSSLLQSATIKIFGYNNYGWRFSSLYLAALAVGLVYVWLRGHVSKRTAIAAAVLLAGSHYIMSFGKIGYNNLQALLALALVLAAAGRAARARTPLSYILLGAVLGLCFYIYPAALYVAPMGFIYLLFYDPPFDRDALQRWLLAVTALLFLILPLLPQRDYWMAKIAGTFLYTPDIMVSSSSIWHHFGENGIYALVSFVFFVQPSHFVAFSLLDPLTAVFLILGGGLTLAIGWRRKFSAFLLVSFLFALIAVGATHDRPQPPITRMFLLLPWYATLAAFGLEWLVARLGALGLGARLKPVALGVVLSGILIVNLYQAYPLSRRISAGQYQSLQVLFLRQAMDIFESDSSLPSHIIFLNYERSFVVESLHELLEVYGVQYPPEALQEFDVEGSGLPDDHMNLFDDERALVIMIPWMGPEDRQIVTKELLGLGMESCEVRNSNQYVRFEIWHYPSFQVDCY
jgi:4-amino-4-deoxy-L-arabinose transferase-like glycosyltransferase